MVRIGTIILMVSLLAAVPAYAQSAHSHGQAAGQHSMQDAKQGGEHGEHNDAVHRYAPKMMLKHGEMLKLTTSQVTKLEALHDAHQTDCHARMELMKAAEAAANAALELATPDITAFETKMREAANLKVDCKVDMVKTGQNALGVLTEEQRAHLAHMKHAGH